VYTRCYATIAKRNTRYLVTASIQAVGRQPPIAILEELLGSVFSVGYALGSTGFAKQIMPILRILCYNGSLVT
jgi:hypothetical protein